MSFKMRGPGCGMADCIDFFARTVVDFENRSHVVVPEKSVAKDETKKQKRTRYNDSWTQLFGCFFAYL